jgi:Flp pilus assembly protein TadG
VTIRGGLRPRLSPSGRPGSEGQATVEVALALPVVVVALLLVIQVALVARAQVLVVQAAREGARASSVGESPEVARHTPGLDPTRVEVSQVGGTVPGSVVTVRVAYRAATDVPLVGGLLGDVTVRAAVTMRVEGPT